jgi:cysteine-rich repeat protein
MKKRRKKMKKVVVALFLAFLVLWTFASGSWAETCPSGIGCDSGILNLPCDPVTVTHGPWLGGTNSTLDITLSNVPSGFDATDGTTYTGWCIEDNLKPDLNAPLLVDSTCDQVDLPSSYQGIPWDKVNYLLNHKIGTSLDVQNALYYVAGADSAATPPPNANVQAMIDNANANGDGFLAGPGQVTAVVIFADGIGKFGAAPDDNQDTIIEVPIPSDVCGNGIVGNTPGETYDPPGSPAGASGNLCRSDCTDCGDGTLDTGESCDDGNNVSGDGCEPDCTQVCDDRKTNFTISLTPKEKFVVEKYRAYTHASSTMSPLMPTTISLIGTLRLAFSPARFESTVSPPQQGTCILMTVRVLIFASSMRAWSLAR